MKRVVLFLLLLAYIIGFAANKWLEKTIGYDYDSTLAFSTPAFLAEKEQEPSDRLDWDLINGPFLNLEKKKHISWTIPMARIFGYTPIVITARPEVRADLFKAHVQKIYGIKPKDIYMTKEKANILKQRNAVLFFGDSDGDITEAQKAGVLAIRVKRSEDDQYKENYHPGQYGEFVMPFSAGHQR